MITPRARASRKNQAGYVTVLISVLFGLAFTATVLGSAAYIRSTEAVSMASHAQTQAQLKAWTGTEIVREYLAAQQTSGNLTALAAVVTLAPTPLTINGVTGFAATLTAVDHPSRLLGHHDRRECRAAGAQLQPQPRARGFDHGQWRIRHHVLA